jgi:hypothetical protein
VSLTNLTGSVSDIQDDPDSPDSNYLLTNSSGAATCIADFPAPPFRMAAGATQEIRSLVRKNNSGGNSVGYTVELRQGGTVVASANFTAGAATVVSVTANTSAFSQIQGTSVDVRIVQTSGATGATNNRRYIEVGAIEWNAVHDASVTSRVTLIL